MINGNVLVAYDGYYYLYSGGQKQFAYLQGKRSPSDKSIASFVRNISARKKYCKSKNIRYRHMVFPSKPVVVSEFLPKEYTAVRSLFEEKYQSSLSGLPILYPKELLMQSSVPTFHKTDTHCNLDGNLLLSELIITQFDRQVDYSTLVRLEADFVGDLGKMINLDLSEKIVKSQYPKRNQVIAFNNKKELPGNTNDVSIWKNCDKNIEGRLLIFGDSFSKACLPYLYQSFSDVIYIRSSFFHRDIVELLAPDCILTTNAERYLKNVNCDSTANNFLLELYGKSEYSPQKGFLDAFKAQLSFRYYNEIYNNWISSLFVGTK